MIRTNIIEELNALYEETKSQRNIIYNELAQCPPGDLQCHISHGRPQYYQVTVKSKERTRRGINRDKTLLQKLARKLYLKEWLQICDHNLELLSKIISGASKFDPSEIIKMISSPFPTLPEDYYLRPVGLSSQCGHDSEFTKRVKKYEKWASAPYEQSTYKPYNRRITVNNGLKVRSKSEALIANLLIEYGIPFRYEEVIHFGDFIVTPDFVLMTRNGREIYWEHAGMLNDAKYAFRHHVKMMQYESAGIYPWQNLIITYDTDNEINMTMIDSIIKNIVLPRL